MSTERPDPAGWDGESRRVLQLLAGFAVHSMRRYFREKRVGGMAIKRELQGEMRRAHEEGK